jgi:2-amino-4-hydroxy-6-hydroxymethyldihydropteridine diphosphokinase
MARAFVGLGSNLGDRKGFLTRAVEALRHTRGVRVRRLSSFLESRAVVLPGTDAAAAPPDYLNAVAALETDLSPRELLARLQRIEAELGRMRTTRWGPRTIDLDLLLYDDRVIDTPELQVPHPRMHARGFVLRPLVEIAPDARHPVLGKRAHDLLESL